MKTKFTLMMIASLFFVVSTKAQDRYNQQQDNGYGYRNDNRSDRFEDRDYRAQQIYNLQLRLNHEMEEMGRAMDCRDWDKVHHEREEIAEIRSQIWQLSRYRRSHDDDDYHHRVHEYHERY